MGAIEFWTGCRLDIDLGDLRQASVSVKGNKYHNPCRALEIFGNLPRCSDGNGLKFTLDLLDFSVQPSHLVFASGFQVPFGDEASHPPFIWKDCSPSALALNFTYMTNAFYRILKGLVDQNLIPESAMDGLLDDACLKLSRLYKLQDGYVMKHVNNNLNMFLISKVVEKLVGTEVYNSGWQEPVVTSRALQHTLDSLDEFASASVYEQMSLALGRGIAFLEDSIDASKTRPTTGQSRIEHSTYSYVDNPLAIDNRHHLIERVQTANERGIALSMCAILDDTSESVIDLLWMQQLLEKNGLFRLNLLLNRAQVSINFSSAMLTKVLQDRHFRGMASMLNSRVFIFETYCPLISLQSNILAPDAWKAIANTDFVYVKGLNFFETCQLIDSDTYYAFVVFGPVSCLYTGLKDYDAVFAYVPRGQAGYIHCRDISRIVPLANICSIDKN